VTEAHFPLIVGIERAGFDGVKLPIFEGTPDHFHMLGRAIRDNGLKTTAVMIIPGAERKCVSADPAIRSAELDQLKWAIGCLATYLR
jgi:D-psicose/D-tagatose/L-ribulose 3-epimerase